MESSRFPPGSDVQNWMGSLDPVMLAAAASGSSVLDAVPPSSAISNSAASRFAPLVYQHFFHHHIPPTRNQHQIDLLTYHAAALHQHLAVAAAAAAAASNRTFQHCQQLPSPAMNRMLSCEPPVNSLAFGENDGSSKKFGYSVADLLADHQQSTNCDRMNNSSSPDHSGNWFRFRPSKDFYFKIMIK